MLWPIFGKLERMGVLSKELKEYKKYTIFSYRECLAFATEPVFASLANILGNHEGLGVVSKELEEYKMYEVEIKYGLLQVSLQLV